MSTYIIYETLCLVNFKIYVGQHDTSADDGYLGSGKWFKRALKKYGKENFVREIIEFCTSSDVNEKEIYWIDKLSATNPNIGYNFDKGGSGGNKVNWTEEKRKEMSEKLSGENNPMFRKTHSKESITKMSECKIKDKNPMFGVLMSEDRKKEMSEKRKGKNNPFYGKKHTEESKHKISEGNIGKKISEKSLEKLKIYNAKKSKKVKINNEIFNSIMEASRILKINRKTIIYRIKSKNYNYEFI